MHEVGTEHQKIVKAQLMEAVGKGVLKPELETRTAGIYNGRSYLCGNKRRASEKCFNPSTSHPLPILINKRPCFPYKVPTLLIVGSSGRQAELCIRYQTQLPYLVPFDKTSRAEASPEVSNRRNKDSKEIRLVYWNRNLKDFTYFSG